MTTIAFIIGLIVGVIIGYFIGNRPAKNDSGNGHDHVPDHNFTDADIDRINDDLLEPDGAYRFNNPETGDSMRYISFMDSLLMNLNPRNNDILVDHCKNIDTALRLLEVRHKAENDGVGFTAEERAAYIEQFKAGEPVSYAKFIDTCPPAPKGEAPPDWWSTEAAKTVANMQPKMKTIVSLTGEDGVTYKVEPNGPLYDFNTILTENKKPAGKYTISYKITDLELGKTSSFEQEFYFKPATE